MRRGRSERIFRSRLTRRGVLTGWVPDALIGVGMGGAISSVGWWFSAATLFCACLFPKAGAEEPHAAEADPVGLLPGGAVADVRPGLGREGEARARAVALYWDGLQRERAGDETGARTRYVESLRMDPGHWRLAGHLAEWEAKTGGLDEALTMLESVVHAAPERPEGLLVLSEFCSRHRADAAGLQERAVAAAEEAVARFPGSAEAQAHLVQLHLRMEAPEAASTTLERAVARPDPDPRYWLGLVGSALAVWPPGKEGNRDKVLDLFRRARSLAPDDPTVTTALADFLAQHDGLEEASALYRKSVERHPDDLKAREKLARTLALTGRQMEAVAAWQAVLEIDPQHEAAHRALAKHFSQSGDLAGSVRHRAAALRWGRDETVGEAVRLAREMLQAGLPRDALPVLERAEFNAPALPEPPYLAALAHRAAVDLPRALAAFARAAAVAQGDERTAAAFLNEGFFFQWAMAAAEAGQIDLAEAKFREAIGRVPPQHPELAAKSYNGLAYLWLENNQRLDEAGPLIQRALKLDPGNPAFLDSLGWYHFKKAEFQQAADVLLEAENASPKPVADISDHRAQALWALGRRPEAIALLEKTAALPDATPAMKRRLIEWRAAGQ